MLIGILDSKQKISIIAILLAIIAIVIGFVCFIQVFFPSIQIRVGPATVIEYFNIRGTDPSTISDSKTTETARRAVSFLLMVHLRHLYYKQFLLFVFQCYGFQ